MERSQRAGSFYDFFNLNFFDCLIDYHYWIVSELGFELSLAQGQSLFYTIMTKVTTFIQVGIDPCKTIK